MQPIFAIIVDSRHKKVYGNVYAISDMSVCLAMFLGPMVGGPILYAFGFEILLCSIAIVDVCFSFFSMLLRKAHQLSPEIEIYNEELETDEKQPLIKSQVTKRKRNMSSSSQVLIKSLLYILYAYSKLFIAYL